MLALLGFMLGRETGAREERVLPPRIEFIPIYEHIPISLEELQQILKEELGSELANRGLSVDDKLIDISVKRIIEKFKYRYNKLRYIHIIRKAAECFSRREISSKAYTFIIDRYQKKLVKLIEERGVL